MNPKIERIKRMKHEPKKKKKNNRIYEVQKKKTKTKVGSEIYYK